LHLQRLSLSSTSRSSCLSLQRTPLMRGDPSSLLLRSLLLQSLLIRQQLITPLDRLPLGLVVRPPPPRMDNCPHCTA
jgi:hypothetical protein